MDLISPQIKTTTKILNYKFMLDDVSAIMPPRANGGNALPDELYKWLVDDEARALLRVGKFDHAFATVAHEGCMISLNATDRQSLINSQTEFAELAVPSALNTCDKTNMGRARSKCLTLLEPFDNSAEGYVQEVADQMQDLISLLRSGEDALKNVERVSKNKREPILRSFFYHPTCKLADHVVKELIITLSACKETMKTSAEYQFHQQALVDVHDSVRKALEQPVKLRIESLKAHRGKYGALLTKVVHVQNKVRGHIDKSGCDVTSQDIMRQELRISELFTDYRDGVISGVVDAVKDLVLDFDAKNATEFQVKLAATCGTGVSEALEDLEELALLDVLESYTLLPKESIVSAVRANTLVLNMMSNVAKLASAVQLGGCIATKIACEELMRALAHCLGPEYADAKFVEVALSDSLAAMAELGKNLFTMDGDLPAAPLAPELQHMTNALGALKAEASNHAATFFASVKFTLTTATNLLNQPSVRLMGSYKDMSMKSLIMSQEFWKSTKHPDTDLFPDNDDDEIRGKLLKEEGGRRASAHEPC